jgi:coenzyme PQQ precursor peptide PqqA
MLNGEEPADLLGLRRPSIISLSGLALDRRSRCSLAPTMWLTECGGVGMPNVMPKGFTVRLCPELHPCILCIGTRSTPMTWTTPTLIEICIGLEINGYLPAEF